MKQKALGSQGLLASEIGLGCMGMSEFYGPHNDAESLKTLDRALELGINFWDTSDAYGPHTNEVLIGKAMKGRRQRIVLATKFGIVRDPNEPMKRGFNGTPAYVRSSCESSLQRLGTDIIDLYYLHRVDPATPIEETVGALGQLVKEGKIRAIGLSEVKPETLRKAHATFPISAVQTEYSIWSREPETGGSGEADASGKDRVEGRKVERTGTEAGILDTCQELGVAFVAYSPLGRGFLTGQIRKYEDLAADDYRRYSPRFQGENFNRNMELVRKIEALASQKGSTPSQLALAWVLAQGEHIIPIPGTKRIKYLDENAGALAVQLTPAELSLIDAIAPTGVVVGGRYAPEMMGSLNR